jgi:hypothetical protein
MGAGRVYQQTFAGTFVRVSARFTGKRCSDSIFRTAVRAGMMRVHEHPSM